MAVAPVCGTARWGVCCCEPKRAQSISLLIAGGKIATGGQGVGFQRARRRRPMQRRRPAAPCLNLYSSGVCFGEQWQERHTGCPRNCWASRVRRPVLSVCTCTRACDGAASAFWTALTRASGIGWGVWGAGAPSKSPCRGAMFGGRRQQCRGNVAGGSGPGCDLNSWAVESGRR